MEYYNFVILTLLALASAEPFNVHLPSVLFVIIDQPVLYHRHKSDALMGALKVANNNVTVMRLSTDFRHISGGWAFWPLAKELKMKADSSRCDWIFVCEDETTINVQKLLGTLARFSLDTDWFLGRALRDQRPTIIHHYAFLNNPSKFAYPDTSAGFAITSNLLRKLINRDNADPGFTIDAKHELAMILWNNGNGVELTDVSEFCTLKSHNESGKCATLYEPGYEYCTSASLNLKSNLSVAVKTCANFHKTRIVVVKRTWSREAPEIVEYYSDIEDYYIPTINTGLKNTERGHCAKTMTIIQRFVDNLGQNLTKWLLIADDDTLISLNRLIKLLKCYDMNEPLIVGERYGYGFDPDGSYGYDYPTGGSGMVFSPLAASLLAKQCNCPSLDSPDDMIIGLCADRLNISIIHCPAMHQARPMDYDENYVKRITPISFHKHYEIDPYAVYVDYLTDGAKSHTVKHAEEHQEL